jgi:pimeloyl-ACP methyl ester carboxylesterase
MEDAMTEPTTHTLDVPGAVLTYDVRPNNSSAEPALLLIGSPMGAAGFGTLAGYSSDRTVVTYDPRGVERSKRTDVARESTPDLHADDLHRLISALGALGAGRIRRSGPVDIFASSGGAVNALALVARHPEQVRTLVAHEPPAFGVLPDGEAALAATADIYETYQRNGFGPALAKFLVLATHNGPIPDDFASQPAPDPAMFGLPTEDDGSREDALLRQNIVSCTHYMPDFAALREASTRIVIGAGAESEGELAHRAAVAIAERLGTAPVTFPGGHGGFDAPAAFAPKLRDVLEAKA